MKKLIALLLCLTLLSVPISVFAAPAQPLQPFGVELTPLSDEELEEVEGGYQAIVAAGVFGAVFGTYEYLVTTPRDDWSWGGVGLKALNGALSAAGGAWVGSRF